MIKSTTEVKYSTVKYDLLGFERAALIHVDMLIHAEHDAENPNPAELRTWFRS